MHADFLPSSVQVYFVALGEPKVNVTVVARGLAGTLALSVGFVTRGLGFAMPADADMPTSTAAVATIDTTRDTYRRSILIAHPPPSVEGAEVGRRARR